jgi:spore coat protein A
MLAAMGGGAAALTVLNNLRAQSDDAGANALMGVWLEPFVDPLPLPSVAKPVQASSHSEHYKLTLTEFQEKVHRDLPPTTLWGFEGSAPGPTIVAQRGRAVTVDWVNNLPLRHRLAIDHNICGAEKGVPEVRTTIHLHGGHVAASSDGYPSDWITPGKTQSTIYPNRQPGATLWYHDHSMGITRLNAMMGLAGFYIIDDPSEQELGLPSGAYDVPLLLQDRIFDPEGQIVYPVGPNDDAPWVPEFFGTHTLVNGRVWPYLDVEPRRYRFRLLNASNARIYQLSLLAEQPFVQIATDGGLLPQPVTRNDVTIAPGERAEIIVDFRGREGRRLTFVNDAPAPYPIGGGPIPRPVIQFRVRRPLDPVPDTSRVPGLLTPLEQIHENTAAKTRRHILKETMTAGGSLHRVLLNGLRFDDPITEDPVNGTIEIWEFVNPTMDAHPIHLHAVHFQLLDRRLFDVRRYESKSEVAFAGAAVPAAPAERGWKDTILCPSGQVTRIIVPFHGEPGRYVWHCHMLEHEDNEMMRPYVLKPSA